MTMRAAAVRRTTSMPLPPRRPRLLHLASPADERPPLKVLRLPADRAPAGPRLVIATPLPRSSSKPNAGLSGTERP